MCKMRFFPVAIIFLLLITGCNDSLEIQFNRRVDLESQARAEIEKALKGIAVVSSFKMTKDSASGESGKTATLKIHADENNQDYSPEQARDIILENLSHQPSDIRFSIEITEEQDQVLETLSIENGQKIVSELDWEQADLAVFYYSDSSDYTVNKDYVCAIKVPLKQGIPVLDYKYEVDARLAGFKSFMDNMIMKAKHTEQISGLPIDPELYTIQLETGYGSDKQYKNLIMIFESLGRSSESTFLPGSATPPGGKDTEYCKRQLREKSGSNLFGAAGNVAAQDNIIAVQKN